VANLGRPGVSAHGTLVDGPPGSGTSALVWREPGVMPAGVTLGWAGIVADARARASKIAFGPLPLGAAADDVAAGPLIGAGYRGSGECSRCFACVRQGN
jgi:hypothetical protein